MFDLEGRVAVVTGAAGGLGRGLALALAQAGCRLALVDVNREGLEGTAASLEPLGKPVSIHLADVSDRTRMEALPGEVVAEHGAVHLLVNNAGVSVGGPFMDYRLEDLEWIFGVNFWGVVYGCRFFLPHLLRQEEARIVNINSIFGIIGFPNKTAYSASKGAMKAFSEGLRAELHHTPVGLTLVYPGSVDTGIVLAGRATDPAKQAAEADFLARRAASADSVARRIVKGIRQRRSRILIGIDYHAMDALARLSPDLFAALLGRFYPKMPF